MVSSCKTNIKKNKTMAAIAFLAFLDFRPWCVSDKAVSAAEQTGTEGWKGTSHGTARLMGSHIETAVSPTRKGGARRVLAASNSPVNSNQFLCLQLCTHTLPLLSAGCIDTIKPLFSFWYKFFIYWLFKLNLLGRILLIKLDSVVSMCMSELVVM